MTDADHVAEARAVYDASVDRYVGSVGTELGPATEVAVDLSSLTAFVDLVTAGGRPLVADVGCGPGRVAAFCAARGLDVIGFDVSTAMLAVARRAHPGIRFEEGRLDDLPLDGGALGGVACWYSIIHTPPEHLSVAFAELARVLAAGGHLLLAFQAGHGEPVVRSDAHGTGLPLTSYRHDVDFVSECLHENEFEVRVTTVRAAELAHESTPQAFVIARRREPSSRRLGGT